MCLTPEVDLWQLLISGLVGLIGGLLSGLGGVGGGIFFVPALVYVAGWGIKEAVAASLVLVIFSSLSGTIRNIRSEDPINRRNAALLASTVAPTARGARPSPKRPSRCLPFSCSSPGSASGRSRGSSGSGPGCACGSTAGRGAPDRLCRFYGAGSPAYFGLRRRYNLAASW